VAALEENTLDDFAVKHAACRRMLGRRASAIKPEQIKWVWYERFARGKLHIIDGDPGLGKSLLTLDLAARLSVGKPFPDGQQPSCSGNVVLLSAEDDPADTIVTRLSVAGADLKRIRIVSTISIDDCEDLPQLPRDIARIEETVQTFNASLLVIDPLMAYLPASINAHRDQDVRRVLVALAEMARRTRAAVVAVRHLNKAVDMSNPLYRGGGSIGIIGAARIGHLVAKDPKDEERRVFAMTKSNLAPMARALSFSVKSVNGSARVMWHGQSDYTASDLLTATETRTKPRGAAKDFLREALADGPIPATKVERLAEKEGITKRTLDRAKEELGVESRKIDGKWWWRLPADEQTGNVGVLGPVRMPR